jgi:ABC-2 type transport system permease protein
MKINHKVLLLEIKNFLLGKTVLTGVVSLLVFGFYSFYHGKQLIGRQQQTMASVPGVQKQHLQQILAHGTGKMVGTTAYYPFFYTTNPASPWAKFSIGQRDVNPFTLKVKMLAIEGQLYDSELTNPLTLLVGNLDASFVFIFLFPLLIIAFTYNVLSEEQENGVWKIVQATSNGIGAAIAGKLMVRLAVILVTTLLVFTAAVVALQLPASLPTLKLLIVVVLYVMFWFTVSVLIIALGKSSSFNATALVCIWIFLAILFPGVANIAINNSIPVPEAAETAIRQREGYHAKWDEPKKPTMEKFYAVYPQYRTYPIPEDSYSPGWYYAMQFSGDLESANSSEKLFEKVMQRQTLSERIASFNPVIAAQQSLNKVANTDLTSHIRYLQSVKAHHRQIREYFYPFIFVDTPTESIDWAGYPAYQPKQYVNEPVFAGMIAILVWVVGSLLFSLIFFKRNFIKIIDTQNA